MFTKTRVSLAIKNSSCCFIFYDAGKEQRNGETAKGLSILSLLKEMCLKVTTFSTYGWKRNPISSIIRLMRLINGADFVAFALAENGAIKLGKFLSFYCHAKKKKVFYFVVGLGPAKLEAGVPKNDFYSITKFIQTPSLWHESSHSFSKTLSSFDCIFTETKQLRDLYSILYPKCQAVVLPNFRSSEVSIDKSLPVSSSKVHFIYFSRIVEEKGIFDLLSAVNELQKKGKPFTLDIFGNIGDPTFLAKVNNLGPCVRYCGVYSKDPVPLFLNYDYFVFPTRSFEGMPGVIVESFFAGTPVICSNFTFSNELVEDGKTGFVYEFQSKIGLLQTMNKACDIGRSLSMRKNCFEQSRQYSKNVSEEILRKVIEKGIV